MKLSIGAATLFAALAHADLCRYRIRAYHNAQCDGPAGNDAYLNSMDCFDTQRLEYIWIDNVTGSEYCNNGNWIREYANFLHPDHCANNHRGEYNVSIGKCEKIQHLHFEGSTTPTDSIRINYA